MNKTAFDMITASSTEKHSKNWTIIILSGTMVVLSIGLTVFPNG